MPLDRITAGLAVPLAAREISRQLLLAQPLEGDLADHATECQIAAGGQQRNSAINPVAAARQQVEAGAGGRLVLGFRQDAATARDDRVGGEDEGVGIARPYRSCLCLR